MLNLRPYIPNGYCYSSATNEDPFNSYSFKYECDGINLKRTIYYDNLECSGSDTEETTINKGDQGTTTIFVCEATVNCDASKISMQYATTMVCFRNFFFIYNSQRVFYIFMHKNEINN